VLTRVAIVLALAACSAPPVRPDPPVVLQGCTLSRPPPARPRLSFTPCPLEACLDTKNAALWDAYEDELRAWAVDAWQRCGSAAPPAPHGGPPPGELLIVH
jgi:hypothetical protein